jgi:enoyl-CoA hydratase/carnithine racemase
LTKTILLKGAGEKAFCAGGDVSGNVRVFGKAMSFEGLVLMDSSGNVTG